MSSVHESTSIQLRTVGSQTQILRTRLQLKHFCLIGEVKEQKLMEKLESRQYVNNYRLNGMQKNLNILVLIYILKIGNLNHSSMWKNGLSPTETQVWAQLGPC